MEFSERIPSKITPPGHKIYPKSTSYTPTTTIYNIHRRLYPYSKYPHPGPDLWFFYHRKKSTSVAPLRPRPNWKCGGKLCFPVWDPSLKQNHISWNLMNPPQLSVSPQNPQIRWWNGFQPHIPTELRPPPLVQWVIGLTNDHINTT